VEAAGQKGRVAPQALLTPRENPSRVDGWIRGLAEVGGQDRFGAVPRLHGPSSVLVDWYILDGPKRRRFAEVGVPGGDFLFLVFSSILKNNIPK
jgi:hypothetical protein